MNGCIRVRCKELLGCLLWTAVGYGRNVNPRTAAMIRQPTKMKANGKTLRTLPAIPHLLLMCLSTVLVKMPATISTNSADKSATAHSIIGRMPSPRGTENNGNDKTRTHKVPAAPTNVPQGKRRNIAGIQCLSSRTWRSCISSLT